MKPPATRSLAPTRCSSTASSSKPATLAPDYAEHPANKEALVAFQRNLDERVGAWVADATGIGNGPLHLWTWIKWPLLIVLGLVLFILLNIAGFVLLR